MWSLIKTWIFGDPKVKCYGCKITDKRSQMQHRLIGTQLGWNGGKNSDPNYYWDQYTCTSCINQEIHREKQLKRLKNINISWKLICAWQNFDAHNNLHLKGWEQRLTNIDLWIGLNDLNRLKWSPKR